MKYSIDDLKKIVNDEYLFLIEFDKNKYLFLKELETHKLFPNKKFLKKIDNPLITSFFVNNYLIKENDLKYLKNKIKYQEYQKLVDKFNKEKSLEEILQKEESIPLHTILTFNNIVQNISIIKNLIKNRDENIELILNDSLNQKNMNIDDFITIYDMLEIKNLSLFNSYPEFSKDIKYKEIFKKYFENSGESLKNFFTYLPNFNISENDYDFIKNIAIKNPNFKYEEIKKYNLQHLFSKKEFFEKINHKDLLLFNDTETKEYAEFIQNFFFEKIQNKNNILVFFQHFNIRNEQIEIIFSKDYLEKILNKNNDSFLEFAKNINNNNLTKYIIVNIINIFNSRLENNQYKEEKPLHDLVNLLIMANKDININSEKTNIYNQNIFNYVIKNNDKFLELNYLGTLFKKDTFLKDISPNSFYMLLSIYFKKEKFFYDKEDSLMNLKNNIKKCIIELPNNNFYYNNLLSMWKILNFKKNNESDLFLEELYDLLKEKGINNLNYASNLGINKSDFLYFEGNKNSFEQYANIINKIRPDFKDFLFKNKIFSETLFEDLLINSDENIFFLQKYIKQNENAIKKNDFLFKKLLKNKNQDKLYHINNLEIEENKFNKYLLMKNQKILINIVMKFISDNFDNIIKKYDELNTHDFLKHNNIEDYLKYIKEENLIYIYKEINNSSPKEVQQYMDKLVHIENILNEQINEIKTDFSFSFLRKKTLDIFEDSIDELEKWLTKDIGNKADLKEVVYKKIESLKFNELNFKLNNKKFLNLIWKAEQNSFHSIKFNKLYTDKQNEIIAEKLINSSFNLEIKKDDVINFFHEEKTNFLKNFYIKKIPESIIFRRKKFNKQEDESYYNVLGNLNVEDVFNIFNNIKNKYKYYLNPQIKYETFKDIQDFLENSYQVKSLQDYVKDLEFIKEKDLGIYVLFLNSKIINKIVNASEKKDFNLNKIHETFVKIIDLDNYLKGMDIIYEQINDIGELSAAIKLLQHIGKSSFFYEIINENGISKYHTNFNEEEVEKIILNIFKNNPMALSDNLFLIIDNIEQYLDDKIFHQLSNDNIKNFFQPNEIYTKTIEYSSSKINDIGIRLISYLTNTRNEELINWLITEVQTHLTVEKEMSYAEKNNLKTKLGNRSNDVLDILLTYNQLDSILEKNKILLELNEDLSKKYKSSAKRKI